MQVVSERRPTEAEWSELLFAWKVCKHVRSNAIVLSKGLATVGIGAGQMSRVDSVRLAMEKAQVELAGAVLASDAYFPFADGPQLAIDAGVSAIIQPGGSVRDPTSSPRSTPPAPRWCSPAAGTSGIDRRSVEPALRLAATRPRRTSARTASAGW